MHERSQCSSGQSESEAVKARQLQAFCTLCLCTKGVNAAVDNLWKESMQQWTIWIWSRQGAATTSSLYSLSMHKRSQCSSGQSESEAVNTQPEWAFLFFVYAWKESMQHWTMIRQREREPKQSLIECWPTQWQQISYNSAHPQTSRYLRRR
jgi:hypothetical protein